MFSLGTCRCRRKCELILHRGEQGIGLEWGREENEPAGTILTSLVSGDICQASIQDWNFKSVINEIPTNKVPTASSMGTMMIPNTANLLGRGELDNPITTHSVSSISGSRAQVQVTIGHQPPFPPSSTISRGVAVLDCDSHSQAGSTTSPPQYPRSAEAECRRPQVRWGGLGLTTEKSAADLTSELTQLRLSDNTRNLSVILQYQMSKYKSPPS